MDKPITLDEYYRSQIQYRSKQYAFNYLSWELEMLAGGNDYAEIKNSNDTNKEEIIDNIKKVLQKDRIISFPPINFYIGKTPHLLIVSPRNRIEYFDRIVLSADMTLSEIDRLETSIDELGLSSLVEQLGGFAGVYPPAISSESDIEYIINAGVEEWLHQYMTFHPLGFLYLLDSLGIRRDPDIVTINETAVGIVSKEIGSRVYNEYYYQPKSTIDLERQSGFDFEAEMKKTRLQVDKFLAAGNIIGAESYMEIRRLFFNSHGYNIRKLNQAYFAFHGIYAYSPQAVSPIYSDLEMLLNRSDSITDFLNKVSVMTSYEDLLKAVGKEFY